MGIKHLNRFLKENCSKNSIRKIEIQQLQGKQLVIDASIYMYKYMADDALIENMYQLISILLLNNIIPLFVFDGKPPPEKYDLITKRKEVKKIAEDKYSELLLKYENTDDKNEKQNMMKEMVELKNKFVRVTNKDKERVKELLTAFGIMYYESTNEADEICAYMVKSGKAWGCLSDDTDMFVYNCNYVLRDINILHHTVNLYDTQNILKEININESDFNEILIISTSEYSHNIDIPISQVIQLYRKYKKELYKHGFYVWLLKTTNYIKDYKELLNVYRIYKTTYTNTSITVNKGKKDINKIKSIMVNDGFIFV